ncbi:hypothetical protein ACJJTC_013315 [Scirpophaga incertulas]
MIPERANITYLSPKYVKDAQLYITRFGRRSPYYLNIKGTTIRPWNNNVTLNFLFYEYLHNEYKRSFVEVHFKFCDMMNSDPYIGGMLLKHGIKCPLTPVRFFLIKCSKGTITKIFRFQLCLCHYFLYVEKCSYANLVL